MCLFASAWLGVQGNGSDVKAREQTQTLVLIHHLVGGRSPVHQCGCQILDQVLSDSPTSPSHDGIGPGATHMHYYLLLYMVWGTQTHTKQGLYSVTHIISPGLCSILRGPSWYVEFIVHLMITDIEKTIIMELSPYDCRGQESPQCVSRRTRKVRSLIQPDCRGLKTMWSCHSCWKGREEGALILRLLKFKCQG